MAKNKLRGQKSRNVFHIASQKSFKVKNKAKPVTTNLKKINIMNDEKVNSVNKAFVDMQKVLVQFVKGLSLEPLQKQLVSGNHFLLFWLINCKFSKPVLIVIFSIWLCSMYSLFRL
uniref:Ribosomal biosis factor n=1 Tax=Monodon monoceros TaxID=40151 RepID=A0A8C6AGE8_MONMO